jgi:hypothetical protein
VKFSWTAVEEQGEESNFPLLSIGLGALHI